MNAIPERHIDISVVIAAWNGREPLRSCLESVRKSTLGAECEVIVASNFGFEMSDLVDSEFGSITLIPGSSDLTVPQLRTAGIARARGEFVALLEDHCTVSSSWYAGILNAHRQGFDVVGGGVENHNCPERLSWAVYFYDYGRYMPPNRAGSVDALSGNNVSYRQSVLAEVEEIYRWEFFETFVNQALKQKGHTLYLTPNALVVHNKKYRFSEALKQCFHLARSFAGKRIRSRNLSTRAIYMAGSAMLPFLLPGRIALNTLKKRRHIADYLLSLPHLVVLMTGWSLGEFCGYLCGEGTSGARWR